MGNCGLGTITNAKRGIKETTHGRAESKKQLNYTKSKEYIKSLIQMGTSGKPVTRVHLQVATGLSDRHNRQIIEELRSEGMRICSSSHSSGYWLARSEKEYKAFRTEYIAGANKRLKTVRKMDNATAGQVEMEG